MQLTATEGVKSQEHTTCERSLRKQAWFGLEKSGPRGTALLSYPVWSSDFQYHREDKSRLFTVIHSQLENVAAWEMTDCHNERNIYSENGCTKRMSKLIWSLHSCFIHVQSSAGQASEQPALLWHLPHSETSRGPFQPKSLCDSMFFMNWFALPLEIII